MRLKRKRQVNRSLDDLWRKLVIQASVGVCGYRPPPVLHFEISTLCYNPFCRHYVYMCSQLSPGYRPLGGNMTLMLFDRASPPRMRSGRISSGSIESSFVISRSPTSFSQEVKGLRFVLKSTFQVSIYKQYGATSEVVPSWHLSQGSTV